MSYKQYIMFSISVTTHERFDLTVQSIEKVLDDDRISDIVILDDESMNGDYEKLRDFYQDVQKVRVIRQFKRRYMAANKRDSVALAQNPFSILLDSDNQLDKKYIDSISELVLDEGTIFMPDSAAPNFNFTAYSGLTFDKRNIGEYLDQPMFDVLLNCCNYLVPKTEYLKVWEENPEVKETDTLWFAYLWLKAGNQFHVVLGLEYFHKIHTKSGWLKNAQYNLKKAEEIKSLIRGL